MRPTVMFAFSLATSFSKPIAFLNDVSFFLFGCFFFVISV